jgi:RimJ/RimL family protein N-acetyltransferase
MKFELDLPEGPRLLVRPVVPADRGKLLAGFDRLSERSRFFRFLGAMSRLSPEDLDRFTAAGDANHGAFGALDISGATPIPVAIARYERFADGSALAEMAVTVVDAYQGRGVGTVMVAATAYCSARAGIEALIAFVHPENAGMSHLLQSLGAITENRSPSEICYRLPVYTDAQRYPATARGVMLRQTFAAITAPIAGSPG